MKISVSTCLIFLATIAGPAVTTSAIEIVRDGKSVACIVVAPDATEQVRHAASILQHHVAESSGAQLEIVTTTKPPSSLVAVYLGRGPWIETFKIDQHGLAVDGFEIRFPDDRSIVIVGANEWGTEYGVYEFLERYVGVRWLMPGPDGTHVPERRTIDVPPNQVRQEPVFLSRAMSGIKDSGPEGLAWMRTTRLRSYVRFHHEFIRLFPPEQYAQTHPEFFPLIDGKRQIPRGRTDYKWQPCFSSPAVVEEAVRNISRYFEENPSAPSYSLGINDTRGEYWCQCDGCRAAYSGTTNRAGMPDYSDVYYAWCNRVIEGVLKEHPDKWFGCLAYNNVFDPPSTVKLHSRLIPYITEDRMQWIDPKRQAQGQDHHRRWQEAASALGWYDYLYGRQYSLPRVYFHQMADYLRYGAANGARAFYAEAYPNPGEGPKIYVAARLLWNPTADVDALLNDWYVNCAGEEAAPDLAKYYQHWEEFWTRRVIGSAWFGDSDSADYRLRQWLDFQSQDYLDLVTIQEMSQCRRWLESAMAKARTPRQQARVRVLLKAFDGYEDALLFHQLNTADQPAEQVLAALIHDDHPVVVRKKANTFSDVLNGRIVPVSSNPSLEDGGAEGPQAWNLWVATYGTPPHGQLKWSQGSASRTGHRFLTAHGIRRGGPVQQMPAKPGRYVMIASYLLSDQKPQSIEMSVYLKSDKGANLNGGQHHDVIPVELTSAGQWRTIIRSFVVPNDIDGTRVASVQFGLVIESRDPTTIVHFDDIAVYRVGDE